MNFLIPTLAQVDSTAKFKLGQRYVDDNGSVFIYLQGIASLVLGDWVTYRVTSVTAAVTARASSGSKGHLAIALAATIASTFGWFQIAGLNTSAGAISGGGAAAGNLVYLTATAGLTDDVEVGDDRIGHAVYSVTESSALAGVTINYPFAGSFGEGTRPTLTQIDDSALRTVGERWDDGNGSVYIYLQGIASVILGDFVTYYATTTAVAVTARATTGSKGNLAIAMAAIVAGKFGWFQIAGLNLVAGAISGGGAAAGAPAYLTATAGLIDDVDLADHRIFGLTISVVEGTPTAALCGVHMNYPFVGEGPPIRPILTQIDASALRSVGDRWQDENGNVYIYLKGVANVALGWVVVYNPTTTSVSQTTEIVGGAKGMVAVALAAVVAGKFGWFQIAGLNTVVKCDTSAAADLPAFIGGTTGGVDHTVVTGDMVIGMFITVADSSNVCGVFMNYPSVTDEVPAA